MSKIDLEIRQKAVKRVLVTGGAGAIGSRLVRRLLKSEVESIIVVDDLSSGYEWLLPEDDRLKLVIRDVAELSDATDIKLEGAYVFHLAAFFANQNSVDHPACDLHTNGLGTLNTLLWSAQHKSNRMVYASAGCSIAGHGIDAPIREDMPVSLNLDTPYQITKALGEFYCNYFLDQVSTVRCRFFNSFGPGEIPGKYRNVIPNFIWLALHDQPLPITGTGEETRDFIYVEDMVDGLLRCAVIPEAHGQAINLGTGIQTRIIDLANLIIEECGSKSEVVFRPRRPWDHSVRRQADISKAREILELAPAVPVAEGVKRTVAWFRENHDQIEKTMRTSL